MGHRYPRLPVNISLFEQAAALLQVAKPIIFYKSHNETMCCMSKRHPILHHQRGADELYFYHAIHWTIG